MLKKIRIAFFIVALISFAGWCVIRKPYSPSDELPKVYYPAFEVTGLDALAGKRLARTMGNWNGITAAAYNPESQLLTVACYAGTDETALMKRIENTVQVHISKKVFEEPAGPKCPIPLEAVIKLPHYMLLLSYLSMALVLFTLIPSFSKIQITTHEKHA